MNRVRLAIRIGMYTLLLVIVLALMVFPLVSETLRQQGWIPDQWQSLMPWIAQFQTWLMRAFVVAWFFFLGGCFASFLNVVAWRVPRGRPITGSSHCPNCGVQLKMTDNLPVVGWLRNRGRCRNCRAPIAVRYLLVEIALGLITILVVSAEVFWGGINLPGAPAERFRMLDNLIMEPRISLIIEAAFHLILIYALFTMTVIRSERLAVPANLALSFALLGIALLLVFPGLTRVPWAGNHFDTLRPSASWLGWQPLTLLVGGSVGAGTGWLLSWLPWFNSAGFIRPEPAQPVSTHSDDTLGPDDQTLPIESDALNGASEETESALSAVKGQMDSDQPDFPMLQPAEQLADHPSAATATDRLVVPMHEGIATLGLVGLFLGWQAAVETLLLVLIPIAAVRWLLGRKKTFLEPVAGQVFVATLILVLSWRWIDWVWPFL